MKRISLKIIIAALVVISIFFVMSPQAEAQETALPAAGTTLLVASSSSATSVSAGEYHTCALTTAGGVKCWGYNGSGRLGDGTTTQRLTPGDVSGLTSGVSAVSTGSAHTCALTTAGGVKCWGYNGEGQLGDGSLIGRWTPVDVVGLTSSAVTIISFSPAAGSPGTTITIIGTNFTGATKVTFTSNKDAVPTVLSASQLQVVVPAGAVTGKVSVTTADGTGTSTSNFIVTAQPLDNRLYLPIMSR